MQRQSKTGAKSGLRPDIATLAGLAIAFVAIVGGLALEGGRVRDIQQGTAVLIVLGGTIGAVLVTTPLNVFLAALRRLGGVLVNRPQPFEQVLESIIRFAGRARRHGCACLEEDALEQDDPFIRKALNLLADGTTQSELREMLHLDMQLEEERAEAEAKVWESAAGYAPTIGIIGAVLGLIQVMKHLENLEEVGRGIAVAFVATVYGVASANILFLPAAGKLKIRDREVQLLREMILEGMLSIAAGLNPKLIRLKLSAFLGPQPAVHAPMAAQPRVVGAEIPANT